MSDQLLQVARDALTGELDQLHAAVRDAVAPLSADELWRKPVVPGNSVGHLVLHLTGNLNHFVGAQLGGSGYIREREREFTETNLPGKDELLAGLEGAVATFRRVVSGLDEARLTSPSPEPRFGTVLGSLVKLVAHFALHRGQISYLVRLVHNEPPG